MGDMSKRRPKAPKDTDERETPRELFDFLTARYGHLRLDVCATRENSKCSDWYTVESNGLDDSWWQPWWCNPPYSGIAAWVEKAKTATAPGLMLVPLAAETEWWREAWSTATECAFLSPRVQFLKDGRPIMTLDKRTGKMKKGSVAFGSAVFVFGPRLVDGPPRVGVLRWK